MRCFVDSKKIKGQQDDYIMDEIKAAYGFSERQLKMDMDDAIAHPDTSPELKAPDGEFELIMQKVKTWMKEREEKQSDSSVSDPLPDTNGSPSPPRRFRRRKWSRVVVAAAVVGVICVGGTVCVVGRNGFKYGEVSGSDGNKGVVWNNVDIPVEDVKDAEGAYKKIADELGIPVLRLNYTPTNMLFQGLTFESQRAVIKWKYNGYVIRLTELTNVEQVTNVHISDRVPYEIEYNRLLDENVILSKNSLDDGKTEFSAEITTKAAYYLFSGVMEETEFRKIVDKFRFN